MLTAVNSITTLREISISFDAKARYSILLMYIAIFFVGNMSNLREAY